MSQDIEFQKIIKRVENAFTQNENLDMKLIKEAVIDVLTEATAKAYFQKIIVKKAAIEYTGKSFKISSDGLWHNTKVTVDGVTPKVHSLILKILPNAVVTVEMVVLDV